MYDVIIVGTRVAGAATAMLLARRGLKVLAVDRATFPSDTLSTHQVQVPGCAALARWGLLDQVLAAGTPPTRTVRFDQGRRGLQRPPPRVRGRRPRCAARAVCCWTRSWSTPPARPAPRSATASSSRN